MKYRILILLFICSLLSCGSFEEIATEKKADYVIAFGSCNREDAPQPLWDEILKNKPDVFLWGGDNVYADTDVPEVLEEAYAVQKSNEGYQKLVNSVPVYGVWDDHDYGQNDGGKDYLIKEESQQQFLDFMGVAQDDPRRDRKGIYHSEVLQTPKGSIKVIMLDTRYFRDDLLRTSEPGRRYEPSSGTILGEQQWKWLQKELESSSANFNIILSSIQILSDEHGFETWGNFPSEAQKLKDLIVTSEAKNVILLSGDRHISEFSEERINGLSYPLVDFTSSGLTHTYEAFDGEPNVHRVGEVVSKKSFGLLKFDFETGKVSMEMRGLNNRKQQDYVVEFQ
ncbi:alkaline phosphatase D family protein [Christiangramia portivictoriae]|uniref:alkaline phosphatase D family protein n=1 Tax=Christiangramia portivictoriae TaxID=326069 RepID=UPI00040C73BF|nr:alkaline phosphatase D family protein [Christiangramia portivictoriae]